MILGGGPSRALPMIMPQHPIFSSNKHHIVHTTTSLSSLLPSLSSQSTMLDPGPEVPLNHVPLSDGIAINAIRRINDSHGAMNYGARARKTAKNYENYRHWDGGGLQFGGETNTEDDSGVCSPPLWKTSPGASPGHHHQNNYRYLSPALKAQAIARGQRELMEMVRNMPESSYELSLKDLVEQQQPRADIRHESTVAEERNSSTEVLYRKEKEKRKKSDKKAQIIRSGSMDKGGFLLKILFPISFGSKNKKKTNLVTNTCSKVSPKPPASDGSAKGVDKEWWKKRFSVSGDSESGGTSSNGRSTGSSGSSRSSSSSSSRNRHGSGSSTGCWLFFRSKESKMAK